MKTEWEGEGILAALAKACAAVVAAPKSARGSVGKDGSFRYADLESVLLVARPALDKESLGVHQSPVLLETGAWAMCTLIYGASGWIRSYWPINSGRAPDPSQAFGAGATYARRYALAAALGIPVAEDVDAHMAADADVRAAMTPHEPSPRQYNNGAAQTGATPQPAPAKSDATAWGFANLPPLWLSIAKTYEDAGFAGAIDLIDEHEACDGHRNDPPVLSALATACLAAAALFRGDRIAKIDEAKAAFDAGTIDLPNELLKHRSKLAPQVYAVIEAVGS